MWRDESKGREEKTFYTIAFENTLIVLIAATKSEYNPDRAAVFLKEEAINGLYGVVQFNGDGVVNRDLFLTKINSGKCEIVK